MTNTQQTVEKVSDGDLQEEIQFTELVTVQQSRINDTIDQDKDQETTDGLKVLRSFARNDEDFVSITGVEKRKIINDKIINDSYEEEEENEKVSHRKLRKVKNKDFPKDEVYYFYQEQQMESGNDSEKESSVKKPKRKLKRLLSKSTDKSRKVKKSSKSVKKSRKQSLNVTPDDSSSKDDDGTDLRLNIDVIIQAHLREQENEDSSSDNEDQSQTKSQDPKKIFDEMKATRKTSTDLKKYHCMMCDAKFKGSGGLRNHYKVVHATGPIYKCHDCGKEFPLKERLKLHVRTHTGFKPYKCTECGKSFARGGQLSQHRRTHSQIKPYHCDLCTGTFTCAANLALHMKRHNNQKDFKCNICGKGFIRRDALKKHLECLHNDLKTFLCAICNKTFKGHLPQHMRTHAHDRPHACPTCGQKFAQKSQLTVHQRTHTGQRPFRCLVCWQAFAHSTALKLHTRRHTGERPFKCNECNVGFTQLPHWKKHMKCIHKRSKPYSCTNCKSFFKKKNDLETHERDCHGANLPPLEKYTDSVFKSMSLERMRLLLAVLLKRISKPERLDELGFGKRLIDEILHDSLISAGKEPFKVVGKSNELKTLQKNLKTFLEWTVPKEHWEAFMKSKKTPEQILETLTTN